MTRRAAISSLQMLATVSSLAAFSLLGCREHAQIQGQVVDGFGKPVVSARIAISGSTFEALADSEGRYGIDYVPGEIALVASKEGYVPAQISLNIAVKETFPVQALTLYEIPPSKSIFFFGRSTYVPVTQGKLERENTEHPFTFAGPIWDFSFRAAGEFTALDRSTPMRFFDRHESNIGLFRLFEGDEILHRTRHMTGDKDRAETIEENVVPIPELNAAIRSATLVPGRYAFAATAMRDGVEIVDPIFPFEVR